MDGQLEACQLQQDKKQDKDFVRMRTAGKIRKLT